MLLSTDQFIANESFRRWVLENNPQDAQFWVQWIQDHPEQAHTVDQAKHLLRVLYEAFDQASSVELEQEAIRLEEALYSPTVHPFRRISIWMSLAASLLLIVGISWYMLQERKPMPSVAIVPKEILEERVNGTNHPLVVTLIDGSSVILQPKSRISYQFSKQRREVFLTGEAFFEVAKNPGRPFYVYAEDLVTKVLGTSFTIKSCTKKVEVIVKTGRVSVFLKQELAKHQQDASLKGLILTPQEQVILQAQQLTRHTISIKQLSTIIQPTSFSFKRTPISEVFDKLEKVYGIKISYDHERMKNCYLTATLTDEPLVEKLNLICQTIDAEFEQTNTEIRIHSQGCL
ncbi:MAG: FecR domain-containing protein [Siphonobacter sp.]